jgi:DNA-binding transcriptional LysR family regulator
MSETPILDSGRLQTFVVVAREAGFSRAGRRLGRTQSSVSQAVALLEREVGARLFEREGRGARLTDAGRLMLVHAERILEEMARTRSHLEAARDLEAGELIIGASDTLACYLLPPLLAAFRARYPGVELRLDNRPSPATALAVAERRVHVGVVSLPLPREITRASGRGGDRLRYEALVPQTDVAIVPPGHPLARAAARVSVRDLLGFPLLLLDRTTASRAFLERAFSRHATRPDVVMEMSSVEVLKRLVELGFGVSVVPAWATAREVAAGSLVARPLRGLPAERAVGLATPALDPLPRATAAFQELARLILDHEMSNGLATKALRPARRAGSRSGRRRRARSRR